MLRTLSSAAAAALAVTMIAPTALADGETVSLKLTIDAAEITDMRSAEKALQSLENQAKRACSYDVTALKRKKTDWECANDIVEQVVNQLDIPQLTVAYSNSDMLVRVADGSSAKGALQ